MKEQDSLELAVKALVTYCETNLSISKASNFFYFNDKECIKLSEAIEVIRQNFNLENNGKGKIQELEIFFSNSDMKTWIDN